MTERVTVRVVPVAGAVEIVGAAAWSSSDWSLAFDVHQGMEKGEKEEPDQTVKYPQ